MEYKEKELKKGIKLHTIETKKFKTNLISIMLTTKMTKENVTKNALIPTVLKRGTMNMKTQEDINKNLEEMYGASFDCGIDKTGDNQVLKFYIESISDEFLPDKKENILAASIEKILEIVFNPYIESGHFKKEYVDQEKNNLKHIIEGKKDNKAKYALERCIEEMYEGKPFSLYKFGYTQDLEKIDEINLYKYYEQLINNCKIDIFISGIIDENVLKQLNENEIIKKLKDRTPEYVIPELEKSIKQEKEIQENMDVMQGKLVIGLNVDIDSEQDKYAVIMYNSILGGSANSRLFQNVREKASLAYTASSSYLKIKNNIFINCGIEINNYGKALEIIKQQINDMKDKDIEEEELNNAKIGVISSIKSIKDEQDTEMTYYFSQELLGKKVDIEEYINIINGINIKDVKEIAKKISINTIYFLKNDQEVK